MHSENNIYKQHFVFMFDFISEIIHISTSNTRMSTIQPKQANSKHCEAFWLAGSRQMSWLSVEYVLSLEAPGVKER